MKYLKVWTSFRDALRNLELDEIGSLFLMMLAYAETGQEPKSFVGNEVFLWPVAKQQIDLAAERAETLRQNGAKGGKAKSKQNVANDSKSYQSIASDSKAEQNVAEKKSNEKKSNESFLSDDDAAHEIQQEQNRVMDAAEDAGFKMSNDVRAALIALYADYGLQKVLDGLRSCSEHGAVNLAYLRAVLKGGPRKEKPRVLAQQYEQRDYTDVQDTIKADMEAEIMASLERRSG